MQQRGSAGLLLLAALLTVAGLAALYTFVPLADCPACRRSTVRSGCGFCEGRRRVTLPERRDIAVEAVNVSLDCHETPVADILASLQRQSGVPVILDASAREVLDPSTKLSIVVKDIRLRSALTLIFSPRMLGVQRKEKGFLIAVQY